MLYRSYRLRKTSTDVEDSTSSLHGVLLYEAQPGQVSLQPIDQHQQHGLQVIPSGRFVSPENVHAVELAVYLWGNGFAFLDMLAGLGVYILLAAQQIIEE